MAGIEQFTHKVNGISEIQDELKKMNEDREKREVSQRKTDNRNLFIGIFGIAIAVVSLAVAFFKG